MSFGSLFVKLLYKQDNSRSVAKKRLQFALIYDKLEVKDDMLEDLQKDLVEVISRYFEIDRDSLSLDIQRCEGSSALILNTPIVAAKHRNKGEQARASA
jgi:cell division topological specificity factor